MATYYAGQFGITLSIVSLQTQQKTDILTLETDSKTSVTNKNDNTKKGKIN